LRAADGLLVPNEIGASDDGNAQPLDVHVRSARPCLLELEPVEHRE
jgi:hypothetical protein